MDGVDGAEVAEVAEVADMLLVETLMGWDGDRCRCTDCRCERFIDEPDEDLCRPCGAGDHST